MGVGARYASARFNGRSLTNSEKRSGHRPAHALALRFGGTWFLDSTGVPVAYNPSLTPAETEPADVASRRVPTRVELRRLVDSLTLRDRVIVLTLASSGMRVGVIASDDGSDGLRMENLPDLDLKTGEFKAKPPLVSVPARSSKNGKPYMTAHSAEAAAKGVAKMPVNHTKSLVESDGSVPQ